jgi:c(7)-type cytochrome triheme protein
MRTKHLAALAAALVAAGVLADDQPAKKRRPLPQEFGRVVIANHSAKAGLAPVEFEHWLHRAMYTCRVCHVDIGFAMKAGASDIRAADNMRGQYCGACHNDRTQPNGKKPFAACDRPSQVTSNARCTRCHSYQKRVKPEIEFSSFTASLPRGRFGNGVDWEKAELDGTIKLTDYVEGVSIKRQKLPAQKDFALTARMVGGMPDIIFSHAKHTAWNGCELCHPELFVGVKRGSTKYSMVEIFEGKYCGACHVSVAFPLIDCQRCHSKPVQ